MCLYAAEAANDVSSYILKHRMHQLFENFNQARISIRLNKHDVADIYLKYMQDSISEVKRYLPSEDKSGRKLDPSTLSARINALELQVNSLRAAAGKASAEDTKRLSMDVFNTCVGCHSEVKLDYLFKAAGSRTLFAEYMHRVSEHLDMARIYAEEGVGVDKIQENLRLTDYYLDLLKGSFPEAGPSGVVMDRKGFDDRIAEMKALSGKTLGKADAINTAAIDEFRKSLNSLCVACHEPERIK